jgi:hypothetical protein
MIGKKLLWLVLGLGFLASTGCCRMWENWCTGPHHYQPAPCCPQPACPCPPPVPGCAPTSFSSPAAVPVPNAPATNWQRCP